VEKRLSPISFVRSPSNRQHLRASPGCYSWTLARIGNAHLPRSVVSELIQRFERAQETAEEKFIPAGLANVVYTTVSLLYPKVVVYVDNTSDQAVQYGGHRAFDTVKDVFATTQDPNVRVRCMYALLSSHDWYMTYLTSYLVSHLVLLQMCISLRRRSGPYMVTLASPR
jgi:hypothetical protein